MEKYYRNKGKQKTPNICGVY